MSLPKACASAWPRLAWSTSWPPTAHFRRFSREEAGFDGLWASGFELSVPYGLQDTSLISMTQHLDMLRAIAGRTRLPIVADIDAGYGNAISVIHAITEYERAGANAVVIGEAAITARSDPDFLVIARTEALIASLGEAEAPASGARGGWRGHDPDPFENDESFRDRKLFARLDGSGAAGDRAERPDLESKRVKTLGNVSMMIFGNYGIRAVANAMQETSRRIIADGGVQNVYKGYSAGG